MAQSEPPASSESPVIELRISTAKRTFQLGETIKVKLEITNRGHKPIFVCRPSAFADNTGGACTLHLWLENGKGKRSERTSYGVADCFSPPPKEISSEEFMREVLWTWFVQQPGETFSVIYEIDGSADSWAGRPGHYRLHGLFGSLGMEYVTMCHALGLYKERLEKLPFKSWSGTVYSNEIPIVILPKGKVSPQKLD